MGLQGVTVGYKGLWGLQGIILVYKGLQYTMGYSRLQGVRVGYNKKLVNNASHTQQKRISRNLVFTIEMKNVTNC